MPTYVITGANRGLGLELVAQTCQHPSNKILATSRTVAPEKVKNLESLKSEHKNIHILECDTSSLESIKSFATQVTDLLGASGKIDFLINNAGINSAPEQTALSLTPEALQEQIAVNVLGPAKTVEALQQQNHLHKSSVVMNMSSGLGSLTYSKSKTHTSATAYSISKAGLNMLTVHQAIALKDNGVIVICMDPGWVKTDMGGRGAVLEKEESIGGILKCLEGLTTADSGRFFVYDGQEKAW